MPIFDERGLCEDSAQVRSNGNVLRIRDGAGRGVPSTALRSKVVQVNPSLENLLQLGMDRPDTNQHMFRVKHTRADLARFKPRNHDGLTRKNRIPIEHVLQTSSLRILPPE